MKLDSRSEFFQKQSGVGLIDLTIAVFVISVVVLAVPKIWQESNSAEARLTQDSKMQNLQKAMQMYLQVNGFLPCPDVNGDGYEDRVTDKDVGMQVCHDREGSLPYIDLGVESTDAWGNQWFYKVHQRAEQGKFITQICEPASVFGREGNEDLTDFWLCPTTNSFYCAKQGSASDCDSVCDAACISGVSGHPVALQNSPPYFHLSTRPVGTLPVAYDLDVVDATGQAVSQGVVAVVVSAGENGLKNFIENCQQSDLSEAELENCDEDLRFVFNEPAKHKDYVMWFDMNQAKWALIQSGNYR